MKKLIFLGVGINCICIGLNLVGRRKVVKKNEKHNGCCAGTSIYNMVLFSVGDVT